MFFSKKFLFSLVFSLLVIAIGLEFAIWQEKNVSALTVNYLDVGQGDAALINYQGKYQMLIDTGQDSKKLLSGLGKAMSPLDKKIEILLITHPDTDHFGAAGELLKNYQVDLILESGAKNDSDFYQDYEKIVNEKAIKREVILEGSSVNLGDDVRLNFFNPDKLSLDPKETNNISIVGRLDFGINSFLFVGDAEKEVELDMLNDGENLNADYLKVGHHGSKSSSSEGFIKAVSPKRAIISVGKDNRYHHPHSETMAIFEKLKIPVLRTDEKGTVQIICEDKNKECTVK